MNKKLPILTIIAAYLLSGCTPDYPQVDQKKRADRFDACMKNIPAGPQPVKPSDLADVIDACSRVAYYQSIIVRDSKCTKSQD